MFIQDIMKDGNKIKLWLKEKKMEIVFSFNNYFVNSIPFWPVRKLLYKAQGMKIGSGSRIMMKTHIVAPGSIEIGDHTYINEYCCLDGRSGIKIGSNVTIAIYSKLISAGHYIDDEDFAYNGSCICIEDHAVVFAGSIVLAGVVIHEGCVISAGSIAKRGDYKRLGVYAGNPIVYLRQRNSELHYEQDYWHPIFR